MSVWQAPSAKVHVWGRNWFYAINTDCARSGNSWWKIALPNVAWLSTGGSGRRPPFLSQISLSSLIELLRCLQISGARIPPSFKRRTYFPQCLFWMIFVCPLVLITNSILGSNSMESSSSSGAYQWKGSYFGPLLEMPPRECLRWCLGCIPRSARMATVHSPLERLMKHCWNFPIMAADWIDSLLERNATISRGVRATSPNEYFRAGFLRPPSPSVDKPRSLWAEHSEDWGDEFDGFFDGVLGVPSMLLMRSNPNISTCSLWSVEWL